jgi:hypothetical protein
VRTPEEAYYKKDSIISDVIHRIRISNPHEISFGDEEDAVMTCGDTNADSSGSELAYPLD